MKKFIVVLLLALGISATAFSQPRSIGGRIGYGLEVSYQHSFNKNFVEADLGLFGFHGLNVAAVYDFMIAQPNWTAGTWGFYAGPGAAVGISFPFTNKDTSYPGYLGVGVGGQIGLEYICPKTPLQISIDWRPMIGPAITGDGIYFWSEGLYGGGLSLRYFF